MDDFHSAAITYIQNAAQKRSRRKPAADPAGQAEAFYRTSQHSPGQPLPCLPQGPAGSSARRRR
eukprot:15278622-Alexandrium_andersonii.AAC.1